MTVNHTDPYRSQVPLQTVIVTGGNSGLGYACASALLAASPSWHVVIACRDPSRAQNAVEALSKSAAPGAKVEAMNLDLASLASIRAFAAELDGKLKSAGFLRGMASSAMPPCKAQRRSRSTALRRRSVLVILGTTCSSTCSCR